MCVHNANIRKYIQKYAYSIRIGFINFEQLELIESMCAYMYVLYCSVAYCVLSSFIVIKTELNYERTPKKLSQKLKQSECVHDNTRLQFFI